MPLPVMHLRNKQTIVKTVNAPNCHCEQRSDVAISGRQLQFVQGVDKMHGPIASVAALSERHAGCQYLRHGFNGMRLPGLSLRGPNGAVAISGRQLRFRRGFPVIHSGTARLPRRFAPRNDTSGECGGAPAPSSGLMTPYKALTDCRYTPYFGAYRLTTADTSRRCFPEIAPPRALPRASRSGRHVGLRPPRNDKSGASAILMRQCSAGPGCPLPYNA